MTVAAILLLACPAAAGWTVFSSSNATLAIETVVAYRDGPAGLKAAAAASATNDIAIVGVVEKNDGESVWTVLPLSTGTLTFVARFSAPDGKTESAPPVRLAVADPSVPREADIADIKAPLKARPALWPWLLAILIAAVGWEIRKRLLARRDRRGVAPVISKPVLPPEEIAIRAIAELRASGMARSDPPAYYLRLTDVLRAYLEARYGDPFTAMTSAEVGRLVKARSADLRIGADVRDLLARADLVKFAKARPDGEEGERDAELALKLIADTTPRDLTAGAPR